MTERLRVAVVGAGIGGLGFALAMHKFSKDISVDIYECTPKVTEHGVGVCMWTRPWNILVELGLEDDLQAVANSGAKFQYRKCDQRCGISFDNPSDGYGLMTFHRADLQRILCKHLPPSFPVHFLKRLVSYTESSAGDIVLHFSDGSRATCDVLVGSDGIKSPVRGTLYRGLAERAERIGDRAKAAEALSHVNATYSGMSSYRGLVRKDVLQKKYPGHNAMNGPRVCVGKNKTVVIYPVSGGQAINMAVLVAQPELEGTTLDGPWVIHGTKEEMLPKFSAWETDVQNLLDCMDNVSLWAINTVMALPTFVGKQVALLGDAAHAMMPSQGSGAGQALEDGYILASVLGHPSVTRATIQHALQAYDAIRRPFALDVQRRARLNGIVLHFNGPGRESLSEEESANGAVSLQELQSIASTVDDLMSWMGVGTAKEERDQALSKLEKSLAQTDMSASAAGSAY